MMHSRIFPIARVALATYLVDNLASLRNAAGLLGGPEAAKRVAKLAQDLSEPVPLSPRLARSLEWLEGLLTLERVHDCDTIEAECFAAIDPADPVVEEICLLTDEYTDRLAALREKEATVFEVQVQAA